MTLEIIQLPVLKDNYSYLVRDQTEGVTAIIDPAESELAQIAIDRMGGRLDYILNTHHHADHTGGNESLRRRYGAKVFAGDRDKGRIKGMDEGLADGQTLAIGRVTCQVIATPGHTKGHIVYWFEESGALFCGDTMFSLGCGGLFEGTPAEMWQSLCKIRALPDDTRIYCAHEYTDYFAGFALSVDGQNEELKAKQKTVLDLRAGGKPTIPSLLGEEKRLNPFLRADDPRLVISANFKAGSPVEVFAQLIKKEVGSG